MEGRIPPPEARSCSRLEAGSQICRLGLLVTLKRRIFEPVTLEVQATGQPQVLIQIRQPFIAEKAVHGGDPHAAGTGQIPLRPAAPVHLLPQHHTVIAQRRMLVLLVRPAHLALRALLLRLRVAMDPGSALELLSTPAAVLFSANARPPLPLRLPTGERCFSSRALRRCLHGTERFRAGS